MARKSLRLSAAAETQSSHKRSGSSTTATPATATKRSRSNKATPVKVTPTKSQYFKKSKKQQDDYDEDEESEESPTEDDDDGSDFGNDEAGQGQTSDNDDEDDEEYDSNEENVKKSTPRKGSSAKKNGGSEVWREGVSAGLGPGKQVIIKRPKARPAGNTPYLDDTIHPNTFLFLSELKANNNREWLKLHDPIFRQAEKDWHSFVEKLTEKLSEIDDTVPELPVKDVIFRIYRDVRFSKDPTPYKPHFSAAWSRTGRKGPYGHYYLHVAPGESFVGGGIWHPEADRVALLRSDIDRHPNNIKQVLLDDGIRKSFLKNAPKNDAKVKKAFCASNSGNALKTKPKGYDGDHADIDLLRLRNYTLGRSLRDDEVLGTGGMARICELFADLKPLIFYLNSVVMPDPGAAGAGNDDSSSSAGSDESDESSSGKDEEAGEEGHED